MRFLHSSPVDNTSSNNIRATISLFEDLGGVLGGDELGDLANGDGLALVSAMQSVHTHIHTYSQQEEQWGEKRTSM